MRQRSAALRLAALLLGLVPLAAAPQASARATRPVLANRCFTLAAAAHYVAPAGAGYRAVTRARRHAGRFYLKPTGIGTYMVYDTGRRLLTDAARRGAQPGPAAEWAIRRTHGSFALRATSNDRQLAVGRGGAVVTRAAGGPRTRFRLARARGCRAYPEAGVNARGRTFKPTRRDGSLIGFADAHLHITANLRAGGLVVSGGPFDPFGVTEALGHDADVHGPDGSLDITGNLLRSGSAAGTHDTHGWPTFAGWPTFDTYTHQQVYYRWLERAWRGGLRLVVAQTVEDQPLCQIEPRKSHSCDETATVEAEVRELKGLERYVDAQSGGRGRGWFRLVYTPAQARRAILRGKLAILVGVESSNPFGCSESLGRPQCDRADIDAGIARMHRIGVRTMFLAHWVDNALAGAALEGGDKGTFISSLQVAQTGLPFSTGACPHPGQGEEVGPLPGPQCNTRGLTALGEYAVRRMMAAHMLIEVDHLSERARDQVLAITAAANYPVVSSHTGTGGVWVSSELKQLYAAGGFATARLDDAAKLPATILAFRGDSSARFPGVGLGTDTGGFNALPGPDPKPLHYPFTAFACNISFGRERTGSRTFDLNRDGVAHYGLVPDLLASVQRQKDGRRALSLLFHSADAYVRTWQRAYR